MVEMKKRLTNYIKLKDKLLLSEEHENFLLEAALFVIQDPGGEINLVSNFKITINQISQEYCVTCASKIIGRECIVDPNSVTIFMPVPEINRQFDTGPPEAYEWFLLAVDVSIQYMTEVAAKNTT